MSKGFNETQYQPPKRSNSTLVTGTVMAILGAGIAWQVSRANPASGQETRAGQVRVTSPNDKVLARVNGKNIMQETVAQECLERYGVEVLENMINRVLIQQACAEKNTKVTEAEVLQEITRISKRFGLDTTTWYKMLQAERGLSPLQYQRDVIWPMLALKKLAGKEVNITRDMMKKAYVDAYGQKAKVKMIMLDNQRRAQEVYDEARRHPEDFARLAQEHSVEPNSRSLGGAVPPIRRHTGAHEKVREAAFNMRTPGEVSPIIQIGVNSHVIMKFEGFTERVDHNPKDVQAQLYDELQEQEVQRLVAETFQRLRDTAQIQNKVTGESTTRLNPVAGNPPTPGTGTGVRQTGGVRPSSYQQPPTNQRR